MNDPVDLIARLRAALQVRREPVPFPGLPPGFRQAAVLVPLLPPAPLELLLTVRPAHLANHPGQVAFPGGKREPQDPTLAATALREAEEELGLRGEIEVLGYLNDVPSPSGFVITPVVGLCPGSLSDLALRPHPGEVEEAFTAPLPTLRAVYREGPTREFMGQRFTMHEFPYQRWRIWGATAVMIRQLLSLLEEPQGAPRSAL